MEIENIMMAYCSRPKLNVFQVTKICLENCVCQPMMYSFTYKNRIIAFPLRGYCDIYSYHQQT